MRIFIYLLAIALGLIQWGSEIRDPDLGWQMLGGRWIVEHGQLPSFDFINSLNGPWHDYHWLSQIILYKLYSLGGFPLLRLSYGILLATISLLMTDVIRIAMGRRFSLLLLLLLCILSTSIISIISSLRPQMFALLLLAAGLHRLIQKPTAHELPYLLILSIFVANFHVYWVFFPLLWLLYRVVPAFLRTATPAVPRPIFALGALMLLCSAGLATPYGVKTYELLLDYAQLPQVLKDSIAEFQSSFTNIPSIGFVLVLFLLFFARVFNLKRFLIRIGSYSIALISALAALWSVKYLGLFAITGMPFLAHELSRLLRRVAPGVLKREQAFVACTTIPLLVICIGYATIEFPFSTQNQHEETLDQRFALPACRAIAELDVHPTLGRDHVRLLTHFNQGGWCRWQINEIKPSLDIRVTSDGRTQYIPEARFRESFGLYQGKGGWKKTLDSLSPDVILVARDSALKEILLLSKEWTATYRDKDFLVFIPIKQSKDYSQG